MATATYLGRDDTTHGNWIGIYGADGFEVPDAASFTGEYLPTYVSDLSNTSDGNYTYEQNTPNAYGLLRPATVGETAGTRYAPFWVSVPYGGFDTLFTVSQSCTLGVYAYDPNDYRTETIAVLDGSENVLVSPIEFTSFGNGSWFVFELTAGSYIVRSTLVSFDAYNSVLSGFFWGPTGFVMPSAGPFGRLCGYGQGNGLQF